MSILSLKYSAQETMYEKNGLLHYVIQILNLFGRESVVIHDEVVDRSREGIVDLTVLCCALLPCTSDEERVFI